MTDLSWQLLIALLVFLAVFLLSAYGYPLLRWGLRRMRDWYELVLVRQLLIDIDPRAALTLAILCVLSTGLAAHLIIGGYHWFILGCAAGAFIPNALVRHLQLRRRKRLDQQLVDGITTIASGVRAGLNLVQSMELLVQNSTGPIRQEFGQLLREYNLGMDLNQAMRNASNRIGSTHYRLLFTAVEMHRKRGGDTGESLDRICESIREIQRLEGKLDAVTAHGRTQARMMAAMMAVILLILYAIDPSGVDQLFLDPLGRVLMLVAVLLMAAGFYWIRAIMRVDI